VYTYGQGFAVADLTAPQSVVDRNYLDYIVSVEWPVTADTRLNVQGFQRIFYGGSDSDLAIKSGGVGATVLLAHKLTSTLEPQILWIQNFQDAGGLIRPRLNWTPMQNISVAFGIDIFTGSTDGFFGRYSNRDRLYTELRYSF
jgi:hypothetical protein